MAMDETSCRGRTKHRTSEERTPVGTQSAEGYCRKCDQRDPGRRRDELPEAPQSSLAHFSVLPDERMERDAHPARPASPQYSIPMCLRITFSGSTNSDSDISVPPSIRYMTLIAPVAFVKLILSFNQ